MVKGWENVVSELNLGDSSMACNCQSDSESDDALFGERGIEDSIDSIPFAETGGTAEDSSELDILSENFGAE